MSQINSNVESNKHRLWNGFLNGKVQHLKSPQEEAMLSASRASLWTGEHLTGEGLYHTDLHAATGDSMRQGTDVLIVGGGPAGLAAAIAVRSKGFQVTVADGTKPPIDKACGEGLMPGTLAALRELGITIDSGEGQPFRGIRFLDESVSVEASFSGECGAGVRRTVLHQKMAERARECGVDFLWNTTVNGLRPDGAIIEGRLLKADWIIGADGIHSRVRRWSGLEADFRPEFRFAQRQHYRVKPWTDYVEVHWGRHTQAYVTPLATEETCVVLITRDPRMRLSEGLSAFPMLADRLAKAELSSVERGAVTTTRMLPRVYRRNIALTGDASGSVDAITGEGLGLSFRQAMALADALETGKLEGYQVAHGRLARRPNIMARLLLLLDRYALLRTRVLRGMAKDPDIFSRMLAMHVEEASPVLLARTSARLGWQLLTA
jgi:flavin-dependent dehydrogenase